MRRARAGQRPCRSGAPGLGAALPARPPTSGLTLSPGASQPEESPYLPLGVSTHGALPLGQGPPAGPHLPPASVGICPLAPPAPSWYFWGHSASGWWGPGATRFPELLQALCSQPSGRGRTDPRANFLCSVVSPTFLDYFFFSFSFSYPVLLKSFIPFPLCVCENT